jgi:hypothetical protein
MLTSGSVAIFQRFRQQRLFSGPCWPQGCPPGVIVCLARRKGFAFALMGFARVRSRSPKRVKRRRVRLHPGIVVVRNHI